MSERVYLAEGGGWVEVHLDPSTQHLNAEVEEWEPTPPHMCARSLAECLGPANSYTPAFALLWKGKRIDERIVLGIERLLHHGVDGRLGRRSLADRLRGVLAGRSDGIDGEALLAAAASLAGEALPDAGKLRMKARLIVAKFQADKALSTPVGMWSETEERQRIFRHDRLLAAPLEPKVAQLLREALQSSELSAAYDFLQRVPERITGPRARPSLLDAEGALPPAVFPTSSSPETRLVRALYGSRPIPDGFRLVDELMARILDGRHSTLPKPEDGWYTHQLHALAALFLAEGARLTIGPRYRKGLESLFKAMFGFTRETHIKQLEAVTVGAARSITVVVRPELTVEPLFELYRRFGDAYAFLRGGAPRAVR
ncbi:MAG: hypothetical protein QM765_30475 [Myxococcales bacterium]